MASEKYSIAEVERRFILDSVPQGAGNPRRIRDLCLDNTRLRLRLVETVEGEVLDRKLGHKRRLRPDDPAVVMHTSLYLDETEFVLLSTLPGRDLVKLRWLLELDGQLAAVDVFESDLAGLVMLEIDLHTTAACSAFVAPSWAGAEVTRLEAFSGGALAGKRFADVVSSLPPDAAPTP